MLSKKGYSRELKKGYAPSPKRTIPGNSRRDISYTSPKKIIPGIEGICSLSITDYFREFKKEYAPHQKGIMLLQKGLFQGEKRGYAPSPKRAIPLLPETPL
jgi:hypothetical protein